MGQDLTKVERAYDAMAEKWAKTFSDEHAKKPKDQEILRAFAREIGDRRPVWDFGCGPGNTAKYLTGLGVETSGLDLSEKTLERARAACPRITFRGGNMLALEFADNSIAGVVAFYAIVHFTEEQVATAFRETFRALRPAGLFLCAYHIGNRTIHLDEFLGEKVDLDIAFFSPDFIAGRLKDAGFVKIETIERDPYPGIEYESRRAYVFATKPAA